MAKEEVRSWAHRVCDSSTYTASSKDAMRERGRLQYMQVQASKFKIIQAMRNLPYGINMVMLSGEERSKLSTLFESAAQEFSPISYSGLTTLEGFAGIPIPDAVLLEDGAVVPLEKEYLGEIGGVDVNMLFCGVGGAKRLVTLEFRGYHYPEASK